MKQYNIRMVALALVVFCIPGLISCVEKDMDNFPSVQCDVLIGLKMPAAFGSNQEIINKHEDLIEHLDLLVFEKDGGFIELLRGGEDSQSDELNPIYAFEMMPGTYDFILLANCSGIISACYPSGIPEGTARSAVVETLELAWPDKWVIDDEDHNYKGMPMWGSKYNAVVSETGANFTGRDQLVPMLRMLARIDVVMSDELISQRLQLHSVRLYNRRPKGQVIPTDGNYQFTNMGGWDFMIFDPSIPATNNAKIKEPLYYDVPKEFSTGYEAKIYAFETEAKDAVADDDLLEYTCLVLGIGTGENNGSGATRANDLGTLYYRADFIDRDNGYHGLLRNHWYVVTVEKIINEGFPDPDLAFRSQRYDFDYTVQAWENYEEEIEIPGSYRLDISETFFEFGRYWGGGVEISGTHPDGWSAYTSKYPDRIEKAQYLTFIYVIPKDGSTYELDDEHQVLNMLPYDTFYLGIDAWNPGGNNIVEEYIHVVSGNLTNIITVKINGYRVD